MAVMQVDNKISVTGNESHIAFYQDKIRGKIV